MPKVANKSHLAEFAQYAGFIYMGHVYGTPLEAFLVVKLYSKISFESIKNECGQRFTEYVFSVPKD